MISLIVLDREQKEIAETIKRLALPGPRRSGRTHAMAVGFVTAAAESGEDIPFFDHYPGRHSNYVMMCEIEKVIQEGNLDEVLEVTRTVVRPRRGVREWYKQLHVEWEV